MKHKFKLTRLWVASLLLLFGISPNAWADCSSGFETSNNGVKLGYNPGSVTKEINHGRDGVSTTDIGTVTSLYLKEYFVYLYQSCDNLSGSTKIYYRVYRKSSGASGEYSSQSGNWGNWKTISGCDDNGWKDGWRKPKFGNKDLNENLLSGLASGKYTFQYYFWAGGANGQSDIYCNNGNSAADGNFHVDFTYNPLTSVSGFSKSVSVTPLSGDGSNSTPYIFKSGESVTLTVSATACSDANATLQFSFDNGLNWVNAGANNKATTTISTTNTSNDTKVVKYRYYNSTDNLSGTEGSTIIYYKTIAYNVTLNTNGGTINSGNVTSYTYGVGATLPTNVTKEGYDFQGWFDNSELTGSAVTTIGTTETGAKSYWAKWTPKTYAVYFTGEHFTPSFTSGTEKAYASIVEFTLTHAIDYAIDQVTSSDVTVTKNGETYSFTMPNNAVTINVTTYSTAVTTYLIRFMNGETILQEGQVEVNTLPEYKGATPTKAKTAEYTYTFSGWNPEIAVATKAQDYQAQFNQTPNSYTLTWNLNGGNITTAGTAAGSVAYGTALTAPIVEKTGYTFTSWNPEVPATMPAANATYAAQWSEKTVTLTPTVNDANMGTVSGGGSVGIATSQTITANKKSGYKFDHWELSSNLTIQDSKKTTDNPITVKTNGDGNAVSAQAVFVEDLSTDWQLNFSHNGWHLYDFVKETGQSTGTIAYYSIDLEIDKTYEFNIRKKSTDKYYKNTGTMRATNCTNWTFETPGTEANAWITATVEGTYKFKIDFNDNNPKISVIYPDVTCIQGEFDSWSTTAHVISEDNNWTTTVNISDVSKTLQFRLVWHGVYYGNSGTMTSTNCTGWTFSNDQNHSQFTPTVAGDYTFSLNTSDMKLSVTYPGEEHHTVTVDNGESTKEVDVKEVTETEISAPQYLNGLRFAGWIATNSTGGDESENITINHPENRVTHIKAAKKEGIIVRATYNTNYMVYFKNTPGWGDVHVFFYTVDRHWKDNGTGVKYYDDNEKKWVQIATGHHMTRLNDKSDIWYYDYSGVSDVHGAIAFNDHNQYDYEYFANCQAAYRTDWDRGHNLSVFVPEKNISEKKNNNSAAYYNKGYWMKYDDLKTGYYLRVKGKTESGTDYEFKVASAGEPYKTTITLEAGQTKEFWINGVNGSSYKNAGTMTSSGSHRGWEFYEGDQANCKITTTSEGTYTFTLTFGEGMLLISVDYPLSENDYRVVYTDSNHPCHPSTFIRKGNGNKDIVSFFVDTEKDPALKFQYCSKIEGSTVTWTDVVGGTINISGITETGIYNFNLEQDASSISCTGHELYDGNFYIRTAIAAGGWDAYKGSADNLLPYIEYGLDESQKFKFTHAYTNWVEKDKNVKFCIANDYSLCISDTLVGDDVIGIGENADWLNKEGANIRFMWNKNTNEVKRAYIGGSTDDAAHFLMLLRANGNMYNSSDEAIDELKFTDKNNWVYQADIKAQPGCAVKLTANYNEYTQYFIGAAGDGVGSSKTIINSSTTGDTKHYTMRAVYDFKTNRLTAGWIPDGTQIDSKIELGGDMLISRTHQGNAQQITFGTDGEVSDIHHIYGVLTLKKDSMAGTEAKSYSDKATNANYDKTMYWISFPFDVKISEVFGVDGYGKKWIMQRYNGEKRAEIGWFQETETFWEYLAPTSTLQAYKGYLLILNANYFNTNAADVWKNSATEANFYFPSAEKNIGIINKSSVDVPVPAHECGIDRPFADNPEKNHKITDSYWNVIGVPAFQNHTASATPASPDFKSYYAWVPATNTYDAKVTMDGVTFKTMHAYMVQFGGTLTWSDVSVVSNQAPYQYADNKNYMVDLFFGNGEAEDHTYINLADGASTDFVLNEDMMKIDNAGFPNIYSFAGAYDVAYNETTFDNQSVMLGVSAPKNGSYTFAMPKDFSGKAVLVDLESGEATDLNLSNYTVELNKGTYNNRFQLLLEVEAKAPTAIDNAKGEWSVDGKTKKLFINDNIYLINAGRIYNVLGVGE